MEIEEHHWRFRVGSNPYDQYRVIRPEKGAPSIEVLVLDEWVHWTGEPVAGEMLRLVSQLEVEKQAHVSTGAALADYMLKERELLALADRMERRSLGGQWEVEAEVADAIRSILRLPE